MIPKFDEFIKESSIEDIIWRGLDKIAVYLHDNPDVKDAVAKSMSEVGDDMLNSFLDGIKGSSGPTKSATSTSSAK